MPETHRVQASESDSSQILKPESTTAEARTTSGSHVFDDAYSKFVAPVLESKAVKVGGAIALGVALGTAAYYARGRLSDLAGVGERIDVAADAMKGIKETAASAEVIPFRADSPRTEAITIKINDGSAQTFGGDFGISTTIQYPSQYAAVKPDGMFSHLAKTPNDNLRPAARVPADWQPPTPPADSNLAVRRDFVGGLQHQIFDNDVFRARFADDSTWARHADGTEVSVTGGGRTRIMRPDGKMVGREHLVSSTRVQFRPKPDNEPKVPALGDDEELVKHWSSTDGSLATFADGSILNINPRQESFFRLPTGKPVIMSREKLDFQTILNRTTGQETTYFSNGARHSVTANGASTFKYNNLSLGDPVQLRFDPASGKLVQRLASAKITTWRSGFEMHETDSGSVYFRDHQTDRFLHINETGLLSNSEAGDLHPPVKNPQLLDIHQVSMEDDGLSTTLMNRARVVEKFDGAVHIFERSGRQLGTVDRRGVLSSGHAAHEGDLEGFTGGEIGLPVESPKGDVTWLSWDDAVEHEPTDVVTKKPLDQLFERSSTDPNVLVLKPTAPLTHQVPISN